MREKYIISPHGGVSMNLHLLLEKLRGSGLAVFRTNEIERLAGLSRGSTAVYVHRMKEQGMIHPVERGKFSISDDPFCVASQLVVPSYISFSTALYLHGRFDQVMDKVHVVTSRRRSSLEFQGTEIRFVRFPPERVFGYRKVAKGTSSIFLGDLEKVAIDCLYMARYCPVSIVAEALSGGFDTDLFERYALMMRSEGVIRRAGYIMETLGENTALRPKTETTYKLNPSLGKNGKYEKRWRLYVNEVVP
jgi:predicted transcriptional regulator of viral defense system